MKLSGNLARATMFAPHRAVAALVGVLAMLLGALGLATLNAAPAFADDGEEWRITSYGLDADAGANGEIEVELAFIFDFGAEGGRGPLLTFVQRHEIDGDPDHYRVLNYRDISASSSSGAPADLNVTSEGNLVSIRIGDPDVTVHGPHNYEVKMTIDGIINTGVNGRDEIYWNVIGSGFEVPIESASITLRAPTDPQRVACFTGRVGSTDVCDAAMSGAQGATFTQAWLEPGEGLSVVAAYDAGTFPGASTLLEPRRTFSNSWGGSVSNWLITGAVSIAGVLGLGLLVRRGARRGGNTTRSGSDTVEKFLAKNSSNNLYVTALPELQQIPARPGMRFYPPAGVSAAALGTVIDKVAHSHDVSAILVDLAVRGYLTMEEEEPTGGEVDWMLRTTDKDASDLVGYDATIYRGVFAKKLRARRVSKLGTRYVNAVTQAQKLLYEEVTERGWFVTNPKLVRTRWTATGIGVIFAGLIGAVVLAFTSNNAIFGIVGIVLGIATIVYGRKAASYTPEGKQLAKHAQEFKAYLTDAVGPESGYRDDRVFNEYLPYAVALGVAKEWAEAFTQSYQGGPSEPSWYSGYNSSTYMFWWLAFGHNSGSFGTATSSMAAGMGSGSTPGSSGSSGFSGGFSGGGVGGGGGGGW